MKIIITGTDTKFAEEAALSLQKTNDDLQVAPVFTTDLNMKGKTGETCYYMSNEEVELSYKNNAFMWVRTNDTISRGVTKPDMYMYNVFYMSFSDFNNISSPVIAELDKDPNFIICVIDKKDKKGKTDIYDARGALERIYEHHYLYFLDCTVQEITDMIFKYIVADDDERQRIEDSLNS